MADAHVLIAVTDIVRGGTAQTLTASDETDGHRFPNDGRTLIAVINTAGATTFTFITPGTVDGLAVTDRDEVIPINAVGEFYGPFPPGIYNQPDGTVFIDVDTEATCSLGAFRLPA